MKKRVKTARLERLRKKMTLLSRLSFLSHSDVLGSYTGRGVQDDVPVQDADDL